jgi:hypothetical protein
MPETIAAFRTTTGAKRRRGPSSAEQLSPAAGQEHED